jgi:VRR-NUC domain
MGRRLTAPRDLLGRPLPRYERDRNAEAKRQAAIVEYVRWIADHIVIFHVPNGGLRSKPEAAKLKWMGVLAGVLDLVLVLPDGQCAFWETKTPRGQLSDDQLAFIKRLITLGHRWAVVLSIDDARRELAALGVETKEHASDFQALGDAAAKVTDELLALGHSCKRANA